MKARGQHRARRLAGPNGDLWETLYAFIDNWVGFWSIEWHPAHADVRQLWAGTIFMEPFIGNHHADIFARKGADLHAVAFSIAQAVDRADHKLTLILRRLVAVTSHIEDSQPHLDKESQAAYEQQRRSARRELARRTAKLRARPLSKIAAIRGHVLVKRGGRWICSRCLRAAPSARVLRLWAGTTPCFALQAQPDGTALSRLRLPTQLSPASDSSDHETQGANFLHTGAAHNPTVNNFEDPFGHALEDGFDADPFGFNEDGFNEDGFNEDGTAFEDGFNDDGFNEDPFGFALEDFENAPQPAAASRCGDAAANSAAAPDFSASAPRTSRPRETSAFQDNTFEGCNSANPHNPAVGDR